MNESISAYFTEPKIDINKVTVSIKHPENGITGSAAQES
jgi:hypothetical protein